MSDKKTETRGRKPKDPKAPEFDRLRDLKKQADADDATARESRERYVDELVNQFQEHGTPILADAVGLTANSVQQALDRRGVKSPRARS